MSKLSTTARGLTHPGTPALTLDVRRMIIDKIVAQAIKDVDVDKSVGPEGRYWVMAESAGLAAIAADAALDDLEESDDFKEAIKT